MIFWNLIGLSQYISIFGLSKYVLIRLLGYPAAFPGDHAWSCYYYFAGIGALAGKARCALGGLSSGSHIWTAAIFFYFGVGQMWKAAERSESIAGPTCFFFEKQCWSKAPRLPLAMLIPGRIRATFHGIDTGDVGAQVLGAVAIPWLGWSYWWLYEIIWNYTISCARTQIYIYICTYI